MTRNAGRGRGCEVLQKSFSVYCYTVLGILFLIIWTFHAPDSYNKNVQICLLCSASRGKIPRFNSVILCCSEFNCISWSFLDLVRCRCIVNTQRGILSAWSACIQAYMPQSKAYSTNFMGWRGGFSRERLSHPVHYSFIHVCRTFHFRYTSWRRTFARVVLARSARTWINSKEECKEDVVISAGNSWQKVEVKRGVTPQHHTRFNSWFLLKGLMTTFTVVSKACSCVPDHGWIPRKIAK